MNRTKALDDHRSILYIHRFIFLSVIRYRQKCAQTVAIRLANI